MEHIVIIIIYSLAIVITLFIFFYPIVKKYLDLHCFHRMMQRRVYRITKNYDFCLLQNHTIPFDSGHSIKFDHIIFGDKYFYCIADKSWNGSVLGSYRDDNWILYEKNKDHRQYVKNPLKINQSRINKLSIMTGIDREIFINIVVVNDDCLFHCVSLRSDYVYIVHASDLEKTIIDIEKRNVQPFDSSEIEKVVAEINQLKK